MQTGRPPREFLRLRLAALACLFLLLPTVRADNVQHGLRVPPGFEITEFADSKLANDIFCMTLDPRGRVLVSGPGYLRLLVDENGTGQANRALPFADGPKDGAQGLFWEGDWLYCTGDGGLRRYRISKDGDRADGPSELLRAMKTGGEHASHAIHRGPDGWLYVLCGNNAGIERSFAELPTSLVKEPVAGAVLRFTPDLKHTEIVADGFRNAYGMDFDSAGELFTFDSDNERCVSLPWYESTRFYHVIPGGHHGWRAPQLAQFWRLPPYDCDIVAPVDTFGRGSPTGVVCYRHAQFPEKYRGGFFLCDWTFGRIYFATLVPSGSSHSTQQEVFLQSVGDNGFAPTAIALHPTTGDLYVSIGGRGTRGAVYRIRYPAGLGKARPEEVAALQPKPCSLDWKDGLDRELLKQASDADARQRLRALIALRRQRQHVRVGLVTEAVRANWDQDDRYLRQAAADLVATLDEAQRRELAGHIRTAWQAITFCQSTCDSDPAETVTRTTPLLEARDTPPAARLAAVRLLQKALGDIGSPKAEGTVWEGYTLRRADVDRKLATRILQALRAAYPANDVDLDREVSRTLAMLADDNPDTIQKVVARLTPDTHPVADTHNLIVLARLTAPRSEAITIRVAGALLALDRKLTDRRLNRDRNWPLRLAEVYAELSRQDPRLNAAILADPDFGRPDHVLYAQAPGFDHRRAAEVFLARAEKDADYGWTAAQVPLLESLPEEQVLPLLRRLWDRGGLEESILPLLAHQPQEADRPRFLHGLGSPQLATARLCLEALDKLPLSKDGAQALALVRALRGLSDAKEEAALKAALGRFLERTTGKTFATDKQAWSDWFVKAYPDLAARLGGPDGVDVAAWNKRLASVDWTQGDADRGARVFLKASCSACHSAAQALGPDLHGIAGRFSREDLFTAIVQPSKDISPRYRTTLIATTEGKVYQGLIVYEAVDSVILQTGPATTQRLANKQIASRRFTDTSLMPAGLLDKLADQDIADLYSYLRSLGGGTKP